MKDDFSGRTDEYAAVKRQMEPTLLHGIYRPNSLLNIDFAQNGWGFNIFYLDKTVKKKIYKKIKKHTGTQNHK